MDDAAVVSGLVGGDAVFFLDDQQALAGKAAGVFERGGESDDAGADDEEICLAISHRLLCCDEHAIIRVHETTGCDDRAQQRLFRRSTILSLRTRFYGRNMRVLVTGGAGFLGSHLCDAMLAEGHSVVCADNLLTGRMENLAHLAREPRFEFLQQDVCEPFDPGRIDYLFHFASPASPVDYLKHGIETLQVGSAGTINCLEIAKKYDAKFLLASTSECYGDPLEHPQKESYWGHVNPIGPRSVYDEAKRFAEAATMAYHRYHQVDTRIVRIFNTYGPRLQINDGRVISNFMKQALRGEPLTVYGDGLQTRSFCYVSDEIAGILALVEVGRA